MKSKRKFGTIRPVRLNMNGDRVPEDFDVKFDGVSYTYDSGTEAVKNLSFYIPSGKILGVVGRSGSGKSTLSQLVLGMRMPSHGHAFVGDVPASSIRKGSGTSPNCAGSPGIDLVARFDRFEHLVFPKCFPRED